MFPGAYDATKDVLPIGSVIATPFNLEAATLGKWMSMDWRAADRSTVDPAFASQFPIGTFTSTARTLGGIPNAPTIAADTTNFLCPLPAGTAPLQASTNGTTWVSDANTWTAGTDPRCIIVAGTRYIMSGSAGDLAVPYVSTTNQAAATQVGKSAWTVTTVAGASLLKQGLAYSSTLALTVQASDALGTAIFTLADGATAWVSRTKTNTAPACVCWTGSKFLVFTTLAYGGMVQTSTDGTTWNDTYPSFPLTSVGSCASDGNGTVVVNGSVAAGAGNVATGMFAVSHDHGVTWRSVSYPMGAGSYYLTNSAGNSYVQYVNGRFIVVVYGTKSTHAFMSINGDAWVMEPMFISGVPNTTLAGPPVVAYKSGVYLALGAFNTNAATSTEDPSKFRMAPSWRSGSTNASNTDYGQPFDGQKYIKVRM